MATETKVPVKSGLDFDSMVASATDLFVNLYPVVSTGEWVKWSTDEQKQLRATIHALCEIGNGMLRPTFDQTVWNGHEDGSVSNEIESIRAKRTETDKPATERKVPTALEVLNKRLGK